MKKTIISPLIAICLLLLLSNCAMFKPIPNSLSILINTSSDLNPDSDGRSSPIVLRVYELSNDKAYKEKDFFDLFDKDKESLATALVKKSEMELNPNESRKLDITLDSKTKFIGFLAAYRDIDSAKWREVAKVIPKKPSGIPVYGKSSFTVDLNKNKIVVVSN